MIAVRPENGGRKRTERRFIFHDKDGFIALEGSRFRNGNGWLAHLRARQINGKSCARAMIAVNGDLPAAPLDNAINGREAEAGPLAHLLRREERLKDTGLRFRIHTAPGITEENTHVIARREGDLFAGVRLFDGPVAGSDHDFATLGHGIARVHREVHDYLPHLPGIGAHSPQLWFEQCLDHYVLADQTLQHTLHSGDNLVEIDRAE